MDNSPASVPNPLPHAVPNPAPTRPPAMVDSWIFRYRWLLLLSFPVVALALKTTMVLVFGLLISFVACAVLLAAMHRPNNQRIPIYLVLVLFLAGYFIRMIFINQNSDLFSRFVTSASLQNMGSLAVQEQVFKIVVFAFVVFCLVSSILLRFDSPKFRISYSYRLDRKEANRLNILANRIFWFTVVLFVVTSFTFYYTGIGVMGASINSSLPFHLGGLVVYTQRLAVPYGFLIVIMLAEILDQKLLLIEGVIGLMLQSLVAGILASSRGQTIVAVLSLIVLWMVTNRLSLKRWLLLASLVLASAIFVPFFTNLRVARSSGYRLEAAIDYAWTTTYDNPVDTSSNYSFVYSRITGVEQLYTIVPAANDPSLSFSRVHKYLLSNESFSTIYTQEIEGVSSSVVTRTACTAVGLFYFVGGYGGLVLGWIFWLGFLFTGWRLVESKVRVTAPVALATVSCAFFTLTMEGTLDQIPFYLALIGVVWIWDLVARQALPMPQVNSGLPPSLNAPGKLSGRPDLRRIHS